MPLCQQLFNYFQESSFKGLNIKIRLRTILWYSNEEETAVRITAEVIVRQFVSFERNQFSTLAKKVVRTSLDRLISEDHEASDKCWMSWWNCQFGILDAWDGLRLLVILIIEITEILWLLPVPRLFNYCPGKVADVWTW